MNLQWGDIPSGVGAVLTGISLLIAALSYRRSVKNSEMAQAELITGWMRNEGDNPHAIIAVRNSSNMPAYRVSAYLSSDDSFHRFYLGNLLPDATEEIETEVWLKSATPPDRIEFIDAAGRGWRRWESGKLERMESAWQARIQQLNFWMRHPLTSLKRILPSKYALPLDIEQHLVDLAIKTAVWNGHSRQVASSAMTKYVSHRRLNLSEKRALETSMAMLPDLRDHSVEFTDI